MKKVILIVLAYVLFVSVVTASQDRSLITAVSKGDLKKVKQALQANANINTTDIGTAGNTALNIAARKGYTDIGIYLLNQGADPNIVNKYQKSPLICAAERGNESLVTALLAKGANPFQQDHNKNTALHLALYKNHYQLIKHFKANGIDLDSKHIMDKWTPLYYAALKGKIESAQELIRLGVSLDYQGERYAPLRVAIKENHNDLVKLLIESGTDPYATDNWGANAFDIAGYSENKETLLYFAKRYQYEPDVIAEMTSGKFYYVKPRSGVIVWFYGYEVRTPKRFGTVVGLQAPITAEAKSQRVKGMSTLSHSAKVVVDKQNNSYFSYPTPIEISAEQPFFGGFTLHLTQYQKAYLPFSAGKSILLKNRNFPNEIQEYLKDDPRLLINDPIIKNAAKSLRNNSKSYQDLILAVDQFVTGRLKYDTPPKRPNTAVDIMGFSKAMCGEYGALKVALLRAAGVPARLIYGTSPYDFGPIHLYKKNTINDHVWLDAYIPTVGWVVLPSTRKIGKVKQYREVYQDNYYLRRRGDDIEFKHLRKTKNLKRFSNSHGNGIFLEMAPNHYSTFSKLLKDVLTYHLPVKNDIFESMKVLPENAQIVLNWFLTSRKDSEIYTPAAKNFNQLISQQNKMKRETFLQVSSTLMKTRLGITY